MNNMETLKDAIEQGGIGFGKMEGNEMIFKLKDLKETEDYKIWDNDEKKWYKANDIITAKTNEKIEAIKTKFMNADTFDKFFPHKRRNTQYIRTIIVNGEEKRFGFKSTATKELKKAIQTVQGLGQDPLNVHYKMTKSGEGLKTRYEIVITQAPTTQVNLNLNLGLTPNIQPTPLTDVEKQFMQVFKEKVPANMHNEEAFIKVAASSNVPITVDRLKEMWKQF
jgi:hypothetical protein